MADTPQIPSAAGPLIIFESLATPDISNIVNRLLNVPVDLTRWKQKLVVPRRLVKYQPISGSQTSEVLVNLVHQLNGAINSFNIHSIKIENIKTKRDPKTFPHYQDPPPID